MGQKERTIRYARLIWARRKIHFSMQKIAGSTEPTYAYMNKHMYKSKKKTAATYDHMPSTTIRELKHTHTLASAQTKCVRWIQ